MTNRRGLSLVELLIAMVVAGIIGASLVALLLSQGRWSERVTAERDSRAAARGPVAVLSAELSMVDGFWGIESASNSAITLRIPYALGVYCGESGGNYIVQLLPTDAALAAEPGHSGYAMRINGGAYIWYDVLTKTASNLTRACTGATSVTSVSSCSKRGRSDGSQLANNWPCCSAEDLSLEFLSLRSVVRFASRITRPWIRQAWDRSWPQSLPVQRVNPSRAGRDSQNLSGMGTPSWFRTARTAFTSASVSNSEGRGTPVSNSRSMDMSPPRMASS